MGMEISLLVIHSCGPVGQSHQSSQSTKEVNPPQRTRRFSLFFIAVDIAVTFYLNKFDVRDLYQALQTY